MIMHSSSKEREVEREKGSVLVGGSIALLLVVEVVGKDVVRRAFHAIPGPAVRLRERLRVGPRRLLLGKKLRRTVPWV